MQPWDACQCNIFLRNIGGMTGLLSFCILSTHCTFQKLHVKSLLGGHPPKSTTGKGFTLVMHTGSKSNCIFWTKGIYLFYFSCYVHLYYWYLISITTGISISSVALPVGCRRGSWKWLHVASFRGWGMLAWFHTWYWINIVIKRICILKIQVIREGSNITLVGWGAQLSIMEQACIEAEKVSLHHRVLFFISSGFAQTLFLS